MLGTDTSLNILLKEIRDTREELRNLISASEAKILLKVEGLNEKVRKLEQENAELKNTVERLDKLSRKRNIVVYGIGGKAGEVSVEDICTKLNTLLGTSIVGEQIEDVYPLGRADDSPLKVEFLHHSTKTKVLKNCGRLKGTRVIVAHDLTRNQRENIRILRGHLHREKSAGKRCYIKGEKLVVNGKSLSVNDVLRLEVEGNRRKTISAPSTPTGLTRQSGVEDLLEAAASGLKLGKEPEQDSGGCEEATTLASKSSAQDMKLKKGAIPKEVDNEKNSGLPSLRHRREMRSGSTSSRK